MVLIKSHGTAIQAEFAELMPCEFPVWASAPVAVEIPIDGIKSYSVRPFSGRIRQKTTSGDYPSPIKFPVLRNQQTVPIALYDEVESRDAVGLLVKTPVAALATTASGVDNGRLVQVHCVLPFWNDGSTVLVRLDWCDGEAEEGTPNPEWHLTASSGLPARLGLELLRDSSRVSPLATHCRYEIHLSPWMLGANLLRDQGQEIAHRIWQREWAYDRFGDFTGALARITRGLLGIDPLDARHVA
jgi:hypothetical protein